MDLSELVPTRVPLGHKLNQAWVIKLLNLHLFGLIGLMVLQALAKCFIQVANFVPFSVDIFDWRSIERPHELHPSDGALSCLGPAQLFSEDGVVHDAQVANLGELVQLVERLPVVN